METACILLLVTPFLLLLNNQIINLFHLKCMILLILISICLFFPPTSVQYIFLSTYMKQFLMIPFCLSFHT
jgi:hypothetical protein